MKKLIVPLFFASFSLLAQAAGIESLENFVKSAKSGRAEFTQVVTAPAREGQVARTKTSTGTFEFSRPNRFRFNYAKPFVQTIVADGQTVWLHDVDLNQVSQRRQSQVMGSTPAALIASASDLKALQNDFTLEAAPDKDGAQWVVATPKAKDGQLQAVRIGFKGADLSALEIMDGFGQRSVLTFSKMEVNVPLPADTFKFTPPPRADVLKP